MLLSTNVKADVFFYTQGSQGMSAYNLYMRVLVPHIERVLDKKIIPINEPTAGGKAIIDKIVNNPTIPKIGLISGEGSLASQVGKLPGHRHNLTDLNIVGRVSADTKVILSKKYTSWNDIVKSATLHVGAVSPTDGNSDFTVLMLEKLNKGKIVYGYKGAAELNLALEAGEIDIRVLTLEAAKLTPQFNIIDIPDLNIWRSKLSEVGKVLIVSDALKGVNLRIGDIISRHDKEFSSIGLTPKYLSESELRKLIANIMSEAKK